MQGVSKPLYQCLCGVVSVKKVVRKKVYCSLPTASFSVHTVKHLHKKFYYSIAQELTPYLGMLYIVY